MALSNADFASLEYLAKLFGKTTDEMATELLHQGLAARVRLRTGKAPAKVYALKRD